MRAVQHDVQSVVSLPPEYWAPADAQLVSKSSPEDVNGDVLNSEYRRPTTVRCASVACMLLRSPAALSAQSIVRFDKIVGSHSNFQAPPYTVSSVSADCRFRPRGQHLSVHLPGPTRGLIDCQDIHLVFAYSSPWEGLCAEVKGPDQRSL